MYAVNTDDLSEKEKESLFLETLKGWLDKRLETVTNLANMAAIIHAFHPDLNWAGFYLFDGEKLYLGPFQGKPACTEIAIGKGVCGTAAKTMSPLIVPETSLFPGHIACDGISRSELVVPIVHEGRLFGVLDLDSPDVGRFGRKDLQLFLKAVNVLIDIL